MSNTTSNSNSNSNTTSTESVMNKPATTIHPAVVAALTACDPSRFHVDVDPSKGIKAALVLFGAPDSKPTPSRLRDALHDAQDRARALRPASWAPGAKDEAHGFADDVLSARIRAASPDTVTPVARLGIAVRIAVDEGHEWVHNRTVNKCSRWTYCGSSVTEDSVAILGSATYAEVDASGTLTIEPGVPPSIAARLRDAYDAAGGVIEPSRVLAIVRAALVRAGGRQINEDAFLLPATTPSTCGLLAGLVDIGGFATTFACADTKQIADLVKPVVKTIEEQIEDVVKATEEFIARAAKSAEPGTAALKRTSETSCADNVRAQIEAARAAAELWRDRLSLASLDVDAQLDALTAAAEEADKLALDAAERKRQERAAAKAAKAAAELPPEELARLDEEQAAEERRAAKAGGAA